MKKLSEIGRKLWVNARDVDSHDYMIGLFVDKAGGDVPCVVYTLDQRRELVREVWRTAVENIRPTLPGMYVSLAAGDVEQFIKEQNL